MSEKLANGGKDVLYIDVEDEITAIIDKVQASKQKIVALVLPKRATVLQSIVNMKLLKRSADAAHKNLVLITSEAGLLPLAATVGLHVARSLQSRPEIPEGPLAAGAAPEDVDEAEDAAFADDAEDDAPVAAGSAVAAARRAKDGQPLDKSRTVGELAGAAAIDGQLDDDESIDLDNDALDAAPAAGAAGLGAAAKAKKGTNKKLKIPNFNRFRMLILLGSLGVVALVVLLYVALAVMPKATIAIKTDSQSVSSSGAMALKTDPSVTLDTETGTVPAISQQVQKTANQQVAATGEQNNGHRATGNMKITNCTSSPVTLPAGTGVSAGGFTFITQESTTLSDGNFTSGGNCKTTGSHVDTVAVAAQQAGTKYNVAARTDYAVAGHTGVTGSGSAMTGGTDDITKIVTQGDIDNAKQKLSSADTDSIKQELKTGLVNKGYYAVDASFNAGIPDVKTSANPGEAAENVTVTETTTYTMLGVKTADIEKIVQNDVKDKIDLKKQKILDYGLDAISIAPQSQDASGATVSYQTNVVVGSELDEDAIKTAVAGKKAGDAKNIIKKNPGVTDVDVTYSPFWVSAIPKKTSKITVVIEKPTVAKSSNSNATNP